MAQADGNGEFRAQAEAFPGLALGHEDAPTQVFAGHVEKRLGRLNNRRIDTQRSQPLEIGQQIGSKGWEVDQGHEPTIFLQGTDGWISSMRLPNGSWT
jgi:hypothetical protein